LSRLSELTEKLQAASLDASFFTMFFYEGPMMFFIASEKGYFIHANRMVEDLLGWSEEELCSRPWLNFVHPDDVNETLRVSKNMSSGHSVLWLKNRYLKKNGGYQTIRWITSSFVNGSSYCICEAVKDV
jgi:PAS domain S-box-containing protein